MSPAPHKGKKPARLVFGLALLFVAGLIVAGAFGDVGSGILSSSGNTTTDTSASSQTATDTTPTSSSTTTTPVTTTTETTTSTTTTTTPVYNPTISSDKPDYNPGDTVTLTGGSWQAGEAVHIFVNDDVGQTWSYSTDVTASATGGFVTSFALPSTFIASYAVTATGAISGTAKTSFTDGNLTLHLPTSEGVSTMTVPFDSYGKNSSPDNNCATTVQSSGSKTVTAGGTQSIGVQSFESVKLRAVTNVPAGFTFDRWTTGTSTTDSGVTVSGSPTPCISGSSGGTNGNVTDLYAHFKASNSAPTVAADNASRTVNEGATATNTGTYSDPDSGDNVAITASVGTVTKTGTNSGTWSWSFGTTDGPAQSQTVTITADDGHTTTSTTFSLTVNNVAPTATFSATSPISEGSSSTLSFTSPSDPSSVDTSAGFHYSFACDGLLSSLAVTYAS